MPPGSTPGRTTKISIHALLAESDEQNPKRPPWYMVFLSTLSLRRATHEHLAAFVPHEISIHALLAESDPPQYTSPESR